MTNMFQSRKGAHMLSLFLKRADVANSPEGKETARSRSGLNRHQFAHTKRNSYSDLGGREYYSTRLGST